MESAEERKTIDLFSELLKTHASQYLKLAQNLLTVKEISFPHGRLISVFKLEDGGVRISTSRDDGTTFQESSWVRLKGDGATKMTSLVEAIAWHEALQSQSLPTHNP